MKNATYILGLLFSVFVPATGHGQHLTITPELKLNTPLPNTNVDSLLKSLRRDSTVAPFQYFLPLSGRELNKKPIDLDAKMHYNMPIMKPAKTSKILIADIDLEFPYHYNMPVLKFE